MNKMIFLVVCILTLINTSCQSNNTHSAKSISSISTQVKLSKQLFWDSLPKPIGFVNDYENIYSDSEEKILDSIITNFKKKTTIQIALITLDTTLVAEDSLDALILRIGNVWGVGQKEKNNGIVIGICKGYRKMRIQNGYGIEKVLTDNQTKEIIDNAFIPSFREDNYYEGTLRGLENLMKVLVKKSE